MRHHSLKTLREPRKPQEVQQALVYLKLRDNGCSKDKALLFTSRKQHKVFFMTDATVQKDGPAVCRTLIPEATKQYVRNGWIVNTKLKYKDTKGVLREMQQQQTSEKKGILKLIHQERTANKNIANARLELECKNSFKGSNFDDKMSYFKDELMKQRENLERDQFVECKKMRLYQTTKEFYRELQQTNVDSLVTKLSAFDSLLAKDLSLVTDKKQKARQVSSPNSHAVESMNELEQKQKRLKQYRSSLSKLPIPSQTLSSTLYSGDRKFYQSLEKAVSLLRQPDQMMVKPIQTLESNPQRYEAIKSMQRAYRTRSQRLMKSSHIL